MALSSEFRTYLVDLFRDLGTVEVRRMFGGAGVYVEDACIALVVDGQIMMRGDDTLAETFEADGGERWIYEHKTRGAVIMPYWSLPESALDDREEALRWARLSLGPARNAASKKAAAKVRKAAREGRQG